MAAPLDGRIVPCGRGVSLNTLKEETLEVEALSDV